MLTPGSACRGQSAGVSMLGSACWDRRAGDEPATWTPVKWPKKLPHLCGVARAHLPGFLCRPNKQVCFGVPSLFSLVSVSSAPPESCSGSVNRHLAQAVKQAVIGHEK